MNCYTIVVHNLQMYMKEYRCCLKFRRGDNSTDETVESRYISKLPMMKNERIWSYVKETTFHLQNKLTKNIHLGVVTRSSTKWDCLKHWSFVKLYTVVVLYLQMCMKEVAVQHLKREMIQLILSRKGGCTL
jgi:hypothetical protein